MIGPLSVTITPANDWFAAFLATPEIVNDVCVFSNFVDQSLNSWNTAGFPNQVGWFYEGWGKDSLVGFLLRLHRVAHAGMKLQEDVLPKYLTPQAEARFRVVDVAFKYGLYKQFEPPR